jgi:Kef-type K+ transport system membrane component KefB
MLTLLAQAPSSLFSSLTLAAGALSPQQITVFLLSMAVLLGLAKFLGELAKRYGQPAVLGEILAGVILGQTVLYQVSPDLYYWLFPEYVVLETTGAYAKAAPLATDATGSILTHEDGTPVLDCESTRQLDGVFISLTMMFNLSVAFLLLVAGLEVDLSVVWRQGKAALWVSIAGMVVPFITGFGLAYTLPLAIGYDPSSDKMLPFALFVGIAMSITALPVIAKILIDLNMFKSDMGMLIMSSAMVNDLLGWIGFAMVLAMITVGVTEAGVLGDPSTAVNTDSGGGGASGAGLGMTILLTLLFCGAMLTVGRWAAHRILPWIQAHSTWPGGVLGFVLVASLVCAAATEAIGIHSIFGAFLAGVAIGDSSHLRQQTRQTIEQFITNIFAPLFFAGVGLRINFLEGFDLVAVSLVLGIAIAGKVFGCYAGAKLAGLSERESWAIGFGMSARGAMEIILGQLALSAGLITEKLFVAIVIMAILTSLIAGLAMQMVLRQKQKRRLMDLMTADMFAGHLACTDRRTAIRDLAQHAAKVTGLPGDTIDQAVWRSEQIFSTGLGHALAVPHARLEGLKRPVAIVGLSNPGIDFDAPDGQLAEVICLLLTPADDPDSQLELLDMIARAFATDEARRTALTANTFIEFKAALAVASANQSEGN